MEVKHAYVSGLSLYNANPPGKRFGGRIRFEKGANYIGYTWRLEDEDGQFLGFVGRSVSLRVIPPGQDQALGSDMDMLIVPISMSNRDR
jgi:hypothetical protein